MTRENIIYSKLDVNMNLVQLLVFANTDDYLDLIKILHDKYGISYKAIADISKISKTVLSRALKQGSFEELFREEKIDIILNEALKNLRLLYMHL